MIAPKHPKNAQRLQTLRSYDILDTNAEAEFDDIVALASQICDVPVSLISLVDDTRQWFKASTGVEMSETPLEQSICSHAILGETVLEINDLGEDPRTADNPLRSEEQVAFYAGANLVAPDGMPIGTLCVLDTKPRTLTDFQRTALRTLSNQVITQLELRKKLKQEEALRAEADHRVANSLQTVSSLLKIASRSVTDAEALDVLGVLDRRLGAISALHGELMGRNGSDSVNARQYLDRVARFLRDICPPNVSLHLDSVDVALPSGAASALAMIANEFVANTIKYAFPDGQQGQITISLTVHDPDHLQLSCADNGVGDTVAVTSDDTSTGLGTRLIETAAMQVNGKLTNTIGQDGARLTLIFASQTTDLDD